MIIGANRRYIHMTGQLLPDIQGACISAGNLNNIPYMIPEKAKSRNKRWQMGKVWDAQLNRWGKSWEVWINRLCYRISCNRHHKSKLLKSSEGLDNNASATHKLIIVIVKVSIFHSSNPSSRRNRFFHYHHQHQNRSHSSNRFKTI